MQPPPKDTLRHLAQVPKEVALLGPTGPLLCKATPLRPEDVTDLPNL